ncbi:hypothetical protein PANA5342_1061 [Pantoea ananatis LMG 5342]|nr:hypothetical protein PANA5342_1061 [Pantoea ananatis LMG 5342]
MRSAAMRGEYGGQVDALPTRFRHPPVVYDVIGLFLQAD